MSMIADQNANKILSPLSEVQESERKTGKK
jgi:hypothetical protein